MPATPQSSFSLIVAATLDNGIGVDGGLPWRLPRDMTFFRTVTTSLVPGRATTADAPNDVVMGRTTWESIPSKFRPLAGRQNVVVSRAERAETSSGVEFAQDLDAVLNELPGRAAARGAHTWVIGGAAVYRIALAHPNCRHVVLTRVQKDNVPCDVFFPKLRPEEWRLLEGAERDAFFAPIAAAAAYEPGIVLDRGNVPIEFTVYERQTR